VKSLIRNAIKTYEEKLSLNIKNDSKSFYSYVNRKAIRKVRIGPLINEHGNVITEDNETAENLNSYFSSVFTKEDVVNIPEPLLFFLGENDQTLTDGVITTQKVVTMLEGLTENKTPGIDGLHPKFLKEVRYEIAAALSNIFNESLMSGIVPME
jgi:hypothetical protein